ETAPAARKPRKRRGPFGQTRGKPGGGVRGAGGGGRGQRIEGGAPGAARRFEGQSSMPELVDTPLEGIADGHDRYLPNLWFGAAAHPWQHAQRPSVTRGRDPARTPNIGRRPGDVASRGELLTLWPGLFCRSATLRDWRRTRWMVWQQPT